MLNDWQDAILMKLAKPQELTDRDRKIIDDALAFVQQQLATPSEVAWPVPHPAIEGPYGESIWLTRWLTKRAARLS